MVWVQREYARELAVVSAWIGALLPWNVTYSTNGGIWVLFVRFPLFEFQYTSGFGPGVDGASIRSVVGTMALQAGQGLESATLVWASGAVVTLVALLLSGLYYANASWIESWGIHPVRLMGGLLGTATASFAVATVFVFTGGFGGIPIPIGVLLLGGLSWILLRAELTAADDATDDDPDHTSLVD